METIKGISHEESLAIAKALPGYKPFNINESFNIYGYEQNVDVMTNDDKLRLIEWLLCNKEIGSSNESIVKINGITTKLKSVNYCDCTTKQTKTHKNLFDEDVCVRCELPKLN